MPARHAIVMIHGIGEQVPMDTLRGFVKAVWNDDPTVAEEPRSWSKPDDISGDFELRRITTNASRTGVRSDFFEFYWAHLMKDTKVSHIWAWIRVLLLRPPWRVPTTIRPIWLFLWLLGIGTPLALYLLRTTLPAPRLWAFFASLLWSLIAGFLVYHVGDAARYLHVRPPNIDMRRAIRNAGVDLLRKLHESNRYTRIIVVGHSLGSVIGYDILNNYWPTCNTRRDPGGTPAEGALRILEDLAQHAPLDVVAYQQAQHNYFKELRQQGCPWLVTDFITLGSPLTHASMLLARNEGDFGEKKEERELATCPPTLEGPEFSFIPPTLGPTTQNVPRFRAAHHAAPFAPTRWTNFYFPEHFLVWGDFVGGPLAGVFGNGVVQGIQDFKVATKQRLGFFAHTLYWSQRRQGSGSQPQDHIEKLRTTLAL